MIKLRRRRILRALRACTRGNRSGCAIKAPLSCTTQGVGSRYPKSTGATGYSPHRYLSALVKPSWAGTAARERTGLVGESLCEIGFFRRGRVSKV